MNQDIIPIEDLEEIFESRKEDFKVLEENNTDRRVLIMHLGGIVLECFVKSLIAYELSITKRKKSTNGLWYNESGYGKILHIERASNCVKKDEYESNGFRIFGGAKEGHDFPSLIIKHLGFDRNGIQDDLDLVYNPLNKDNECFIDLRYYDENNSEITDQLFQKWKNSFKKVSIWLEKQRVNLK